MEYDIRYLTIDKDFIKAMPSDLLAELINFNDVIPDGIQRQLFYSNETFNEERARYLDQLDDNDPLVLKACDMRYDWRPKDFDLRDDSIELMNEEEIKQACEFIIEYPQYACLLKSIEYYSEPDYSALDDEDEDEDLKLLYEEPFDVYLERYIKEKESNN